MINASAAYMEKVNNGETPSIRMQFIPAVGQSFWLEDDRFWSDSVSFSEATSSDGSFDVGGAIIGGFNFTLNNFDRYFDNVEFAGAVVVPLIYYTINNVREYVPKGVFYINTHKKSGNIINCTAMDALKLMDKSQKEITYPISVQNLIQTLCTANGITLATQTITNGDFVIPGIQSENLVLTDRQMLSYACQLTGNFAKMNEEGELVVSWYDFDDARNVQSTFNGKSLWTTPIAVTGIRVTVGNVTGQVMAVSIDGNGQLQYIRASEIADTFSINSNGQLIAVTSSGATYTIVDGSLMRTGEELPVTEDSKDISILYGTDDHVITISDNPYITISNVAQVCQMVSERIFGLLFRPGSIPVLSNPCLQAGDVLRITDNITGLVYMFPVTMLAYHKTLTETIHCAFESKEDVDLRLPSDYSIKVSVKQAMDQALQADEVARAAQEMAEVSGYQLTVISDKGNAFNTDTEAELTGTIYDRNMNLIDPDGTEYIIRWWVSQDSISAKYLDGGKSITVPIDDSLCDYTAGVWFEARPIEDGIDPFMLSNRSELVLTTRDGTPLTARAAERYG